jgi:glycosyltransferase involved in cell wall biosynthesis
VLAEVTISAERPELSVVVPCYNEQDNVRAMYDALTAEVSSAVASYEIIFIDNKSTDRTRELLREI